MTTKKEIDRHLKMALKEIGAIEPWFDNEVGEWIFSHTLYPVEYGGKSKEEVVANYPEYLRELIAHRLDRLLEKTIERQVKGLAGIRSRNC